MNVLQWPKKQVVKNTVVSKFLFQCWSKLCKDQLLYNPSLTYLKTTHLIEVDKGCNYITWMKLWATCQPPIQYPHLNMHEAVLHMMHGPVPKSVQHIL